MGYYKIGQAFTKHVPREATAPSGETNYFYGQIIAQKIERYAKSVPVFAPEIIVEILDGDEAFKTMCNEASIQFEEVETMPSGYIQIAVDKKYGQVLSFDDITNVLEWELYLDKNTVNSCDTLNELKLSYELRKMREDIETITNLLMEA